jgi:hypothetical protein
MHVQTHILSGWCLGNLLPFTPRQRLFCMMAASLEDVDGLGILWSQEAYWALHHKLGHCIAFGLLMTAILTALSKRRYLLCFVTYLSLFHLHIFLDVLGSGENWDMYYLWPFNDFRIKTWGWPLFSWQNILAFVLLLIWTIVIARRQKRTPLECLMPSLDTKFVTFISGQTVPAQT